MQGYGMFFHNLHTALDVAFSLLRIVGGSDVKKCVSFIYGGKAVEPDSNSVCLCGQWGLAATKRISNDSELGFGPDSVAEIDIVGKEASLGSAQPLGSCGNHRFGFRLRRAARPKRMYSIKSNG